MIFDESIDGLERAFALNGRTPVSLLAGESALREVAVSFMMYYMNQVDDALGGEILAVGSWASKGLAKLKRHHAMEKAEVLKEHGGNWRPGAWISAEVRAAVQSMPRANP